MTETVLCLYVTGQTSRSRRAIASVEEIRSGASNPCHVEIVDVLTDPQRAEEERIIATPTLVRTTPGPPRRVIGDLSDVQAVLLSLGLDP